MQPKEAGRANAPDRNVRTRPKLTFASRTWVKLQTPLNSLMP